MRIRCQMPVSRGRAGFTLTEMLVVIGIIILLIGILLPAVFQSQQAAKAGRMTAQLRSIAVALGEYRRDFGQYPPSAGTGTGAAVLAKALCGVANSSWTAPAYTTKIYNVGEFARDSGGAGYLCIDPGTSNTPQPTAASSQWTAFNPADGADGPGWALTKAGVKVRVVQAYLDPGKFYATVEALHDEQGGPILYMPARSLDGNISLANGFVASGQGRYDADVIRPFFVRHGASTPMGTESLGSANPLKRMQIMLGDYDANGRIDNPADEPAKATGGFVLWATGLDQTFGPVTSGGTVGNNLFTNRKLAVECDDLIHAGD